MQGDVGKLPFEDESFDLVMSLNGFHAFPDKEAAYSEIFRVLKPGGIFCGCFYVKGENKRTDFLVDKIYTPKGYFTPPYETADSLRKRMKAMYRKAELKTVEGMAAFRCKKRKANGEGQGDSVVSLSVYRLSGGTGICLFGNGIDAAGT